MAGRAHITWRRLLGASASAVALCWAAQAQAAHYYAYMQPGDDARFMAAANPNAKNRALLAEPAEYRSFGDSRYQIRREQSLRLLAMSSDAESLSPDKGAPPSRKQGHARQLASHHPAHAHPTRLAHLAHPGSEKRVASAAHARHAHPDGLQAAMLLPIPEHATVGESAKPPTPQLPVHYLTLNEPPASPAPVTLPPADIRRERHLAQNESQRPATTLPWMRKPEEMTAAQAQPAPASVTQPVTPPAPPAVIAAAASGETLADGAAPLPWQRVQSTHLGAAYTEVAQAPSAPVAAAALQKNAEQVASNVTTNASRIEPLSSTAQLATLSPASGSPDPSTLPFASSPPTPIKLHPPPPPAAAATPAAEPLPPLPNADATLSGQSKQILNELPPEKPASAQSKTPVSVDHFRKNPLDEDDATVREHNGVGISMTVKTPKADVNAMLENAYDSLIAGNQAEAVALYKDVLGEQPNNKLALFGLATTYHRAGQLQLARPLYGKLLAIDPHNVEGLNNFLVLLSDEAPQEALVELEKLEQSHPGFSPIPAQRAIIYEKMGNYERATQEMSHAIELSPENLKYRYDMAIILDKQGAWPQAAAMYQLLLTASDRGEKIPANPEEIQERLTFISSNKYKG